MYSAIKLSKFAFPLLLASGTIINQKKRSIYAFTYPSSSELIRGEYENKIRKDSPPEKIFEVFANEKDEDGKIYMSHEDFFKSICPFSYSTKEADEKEEEENEKDQQKDNKNEGEKKAQQQKINSDALAQFADVDKDGKISIYEYYLVTSFLQIKEKQFEQYFNEKQLTQLNNESLHQFFEFIRKQAKVKLTMSTVLDPRKFSVNKEKFKEHIELCIQNLLEKQDSIPVSKIFHIRQDILKDIYQYQFNSFPVNKEGKINGEDFAKSLISYMEPSKCKQCMKHLNHYEFKGEFSFDEFYHFSKFLMDNQDKIEQTIQEKGYTNRKQFKKLIEEYQKKQKNIININQIDILIKVLDANEKSILIKLLGNNRIEADEFKALVLDRPTYGGGEDTSLRKPYEKLVALAQIWLKKAERIWDIIAE